MKFRFPFQKIVNLKSNEKTQAEWMLAEAIGKLREEEGMLEALKAEQERQFTRLAQLSGQPTPISEIRFIQHYIESLEHKIEEKRQDIRRAQGEVDERKQALLAKMRDEKIWLKAREKAFVKFTAAVLKREQSEIDEIAVTRFTLGR